MNIHNYRFLGQEEKNKLPSRKMGQEYEQVLHRRNKESWLSQEKILNFAGGQRAAGNSPFAQVSRIRKGWQYPWLAKRLALTHTVRCGATFLEGKVADLLKLKHTYPMAQQPHFQKLAVNI